MVGQLVLIVEFFFIDVIRTWAEYEVDKWYH